MAKKTPTLETLKYTGNDFLNISLPETGDQSWAPGGVYELPSENEYVKSCKKKGLLVKTSTKAQPLLSMSATKTIPKTIEAEEAEKDAKKAAKTAGEKAKEVSKKVSKKAAKKGSKK